MKLLILLGAALAAGFAQAGSVCLSPGADVVEVPFDVAPKALTLAVEFRTFETPELIAIPGSVVSCGDALSNGFNLRLQSLGGKYVLQFCMGDSRTPGGSVWVTGSRPEIKPGRWCRALVRWDGRKVAVDVDGVRQGETAYDGAFVPGADGLLSANRNATGYLYHPLELTCLRLDETAWDDAAARRFFSEKPADPPEAERLVGLLRDLKVGGRNTRVSPAEITAAAAPFALHPLLRRDLDEALAFASLSACDVEAACVAAERADAVRRQPEEADASGEFLPRFAAALMAAGEKARAVRWYERHYVRLRDTKGEARPYAALALAEAYQAVGRTNLAERMRKDAAFFAKGTRLEEILQPGGPACTLPNRPADVKRLENPTVTIFVAPTGDDAAPGSFERPFRTLQKAQEAARAALRRGEKGIAVYLRGGRYPVRESLRFGPADAGTSETPVVWSAWKDEKPVLFGGAVVGAMGGTRLSHPIREIDLSSVDGYVFAPPPVSGFSVRLEPAPMVCEDGVPLTPARYPNSGWLRVAKPTDYNRGVMTEKGYQMRGQAAKPKNGFYVKDEGLARFAGVKDLMVLGYWTYYWADLSSPVASVDPTTGAVVLSTEGVERCRQLKRVDEAEPGNPFFFFNALEALDVPGEWYVDTTAKRLHVWPRGEGEISVAVATNDLLVADGWHDFRLEGISFACGRASAAVFHGATNGVLAGCSFRAFGKTGVGIWGGRNVTVDGAAFRDFGSTALDVGGGDRKTLEPSYHCVRGCRFTNNSLYHRVGPTVVVRGVGVELTGNRVCDVPSSVFRIEGNDHLVVSNDVRRACQECDDNAAVDMYRDPTYAGCRFLYNLWEDCGSTNGFADCGQAAIRFDGNISGMTVYGNRFRRCGTVMFGAINVNGGRFNVIDSNVFEDCANGVTVFYYPPRKWWEIFEGTDGNARFVRKASFEDCRIREGIYAARYPGLKSLPEEAQVNYLSRNRAANGVVHSHVPAPTVLYANGD